MADRKKIGNLGEKFALEFLQKKGYKLIEKNWRHGKTGEIDIIFLDNNDLVFVEVKTRTKPIAGYAEDDVNSTKIEKLGNLMDLYQGEHEEFSDCFPRLDIVAVEIFGLIPKFRHIKNLSFS
jgi:putative endonuclease